MAKSLTDVAAYMRRNGTAFPHHVDVSLTVHSHRKTQGELKPYVNSVYFAFGSLHYFHGPNAKREPAPDYLGTSGLTGMNTMKTVSNETHSTSRTPTGDYQAFLVTNPAMQSWEMRVDMAPPKLTITRPGMASWSVDLSDQDDFISGVGPDPSHPDEKALYSLVFSEPTAEIT